MIHLIVTVTMNPAIDKTVQLESFEYGSLNRISNIIVDAGGKGINVSKTIKELGGETIATGFIGGSGGNIIEKALKEKGIRTDFVIVEKETRTNLKVAEKNGFITELNEPGPQISQKEIELLIEKLLYYAGKDTIFVISGSIPSGVDKEIYKNLIETLKEKGSMVFLDADGELFEKSIEAKPDIIKPNRVELEEYFNIDYRADDAELIRLGNELIQKGIKVVIISLGQMGALFLSENTCIKCPGLKVSAHSTVGAGDAMVAAFVYGIHEGLEFRECAKLSMATSAGAVTTKGTKPPTRDLVDELKEKVELIDINIGGK